MTLFHKALVVVVKYDFFFFCQKKNTHKGGKKRRGNVGNLTFSHHGYQEQVIHKTIKEDYLVTIADRE